MFQRILVPLDGSKLAECVMPYVEELARGCDVREVILFRVCEPPTIRADYPPDLPVSWEEHVEQLTRYSQQQCALYLSEIEDHLKDLGIAVRSESRLGDPANEILDYAKKKDISLIAMASHGRSGVSRWAFGSVSDKIFRSTCVPVLMVRAPGCVAGL